MRTVQGQVTTATGACGLCQPAGCGCTCLGVCLLQVLRLDTLDLRTYWYVVNVPERGGSCGLCFESFWYRNPKERGGYGKGKDQQYKVYQSKQGIFSY